MEELLSVTALTSAIKQNLEFHFHSIYVKGEISNLKEQTSGHYYFTLKDNEAQISCVLFRGNAKNLQRPLKNGDQVTIRGEISVYPPRGAYQLIARTLEYVGTGQLLMQLHALKNKLQALGWFAAERKKPLPKYPKTIGVVTSPTGSVIQDILHILNRRFSGFHLILNPVKVQGEGAAEEIAAAIDTFNHYKLADVLIVGRGGGSLEDLWAFNEEKVAAAIFRSNIPVISAVGHETDFSISDFVADVRAPTPSAAAEIATQETSHQLQFLSSSRERLKTRVETLLAHHRKQYEQFKRHPYLARPMTLLEPHQQRVDHYTSEIKTCLHHCMQQKKLHLLTLKKQLYVLRPAQQIATLKQKLQALTAHLYGIDPRTLLKKGYCILFEEKKDSVILSMKELKTQDRVRLQLHDGKALMTINEIQT